jgi:hypothetical protein
MIYPEPPKPKWVSTYETTLREGELAGGEKDAPTETGK